MRSTRVVVQRLLSRLERKGPGYKRPSGTRGTSIFSVSPSIRAPSSFANFGRDRTSPWYQPSLCHSSKLDRHSRFPPSLHLDFLHPKVNESLRKERLASQTGQAANVIRSEWTFSLHGLTMMEPPLCVRTSPEVSEGLLIDARDLRG